MLRGRGRGRGRGRRRGRADGAATAALPKLEFAAIGTLASLQSILRSIGGRHRLALGHQRTPWSSLWRQPVSMAMRMPWPLFFLTMAGLYIAEVLIFALAFRLDRIHLEADGAMGLSPSLVFSLQNLFSAGFQAARVTSAYPLGLAALQRMVGILTNSMVTGLFFLRFTQVDAPLRFSRHLCLSSWPDGHLSCRFVTGDPTYWLKVSYSMVLFLDEEIEPGIVQRRVHSLPLLNGSTPQLHVTAVLSHPLTPESPLVLHGLERIRRASGALMVMVEGTDEVTGSPLLQVHHYRIDDILEGQVFEDLVSQDASGLRQVDLDSLNRTLPMSPLTSSAHSRT
jgi:inward rectifier potassium channel